MGIQGIKGIKSNTADYANTADRDYGETADREYGDMEITSNKADYGARPPLGVGVWYGF